MPAPKIRFPAYLALSTGWPRNTAISVAGSRIATSTPISMALIVPWVLGVQVARVGAEQVRGAAVAFDPDGAEIDKAVRVQYSQGGGRLGLGSSMAWQRWVPQRGLARM